MTVTLVCRVCDKPHITPIGSAGERCPFCGGGCHIAPRNRMCVACFEPLARVSKDGLCGFCREEHEAAA